MMLIKEFADVCGVSVRTLHYYDEIGLLKPALIEDSTGYRYYNENSLLRMQEILFYRELDFSLKSISEILSSHDYNKSEVLNQQKQLLILKKERLERLISAIEYSERGVNVMKAFDNSDIKKFESEVKNKWGKTKAYSEYLSNSKDYTQDKFDSLAEGMNELLGEFAIRMKNGYKSDSYEVQNLVMMLQNYITDNYYTCTKDILAGLGQMYVYDERFKSNIDKHGDGTACFISEAIKLYCIN